MARSRSGIHDAFRRGAAQSPAGQTCHAAGARWIYYREGPHAYAARRAFYRMHSQGCEFEQGSRLIWATVISREAMPITRLKAAANIRAPIMSNKSSVKDIV